ncbi:MAG: hypothetical protein ACSW8I_07290 [bacterium]
MMTLAAVLCCSLTAVTFVSCEKEEIKITTYSYEVESFWWTDPDFNEDDAILSAFNQILGNEKNNIHIYSSNQDDRITRECEVLKTRFSNLQSILLVYHIFRNTSIGSNKQKDTLATYFFGRAASGIPYAKYALEKHDFSSQLRAVQDSIGSALYTGTLNTYKKALKAFNDKLNIYLSQYNPEEESTPRVTQICDSIFNALTNDTLAIPLHFTISKIDGILHQTTELWDRTLNANM